MRAVAIDTVRRNIRMLIKEWTSLFRMTLDTGFFDAVLKEILSGKSSMGVVAVNTEDPALFKGVMARQGKLGFGRMMAAKTKFAGSKRRYF